MAVTSVTFTMPDQRAAGVLLHPTSLPGPLQHGDIGHAAYRFIEFLHSCGIKVWQMLPLGPVHEDKSPYQCLSAHAGNPALISLDWLVDRKWLDLQCVDRTMDDEHYRMHCLQQAKINFDQQASQTWLTRLNVFKQKHAAWLADYALFMALKQHYQGAAWFEWPLALRHRKAEALAESSAQLSELIAQIIFEQFIFFTQWHEVREYAASHDVKLFGDMPIFVALDSADVWAQRQNFLMNENGEMNYVAGVPPDAFSDTGQRWGNPLYDWKFMSNDGFEWWKSRFTTQLELFDLIRIDHFRGLEACWQIPAEEETAMNGRWEKVPGDALLTALFNHFSSLPLVAEDLGVITAEVIALKNRFNLPGMKVLQFAFDGNTQNPHLPHQHQSHDLIYTGTHDNNTTLGWIRDTSSYNSDYFEAYTASGGLVEEKKVLAMMRTAMASVSYLCVIPMQDLLMLGEEARMNTPGTTEDNWQWRFTWKQLKPTIVDTVKQYIYVYQR